MQHNQCSQSKYQATSSKDIVFCLFAWGLTALSAQIGYIAPQK